MGTNFCSNSVFLNRVDKDMKLRRENVENYLLIKTTIDFQPLYKSNKSKIQ